MKKTIYLTAVACLLWVAAVAQTKVYLLPSLHTLHKENVAYNYDSLQAVIQRINPDVIAVEIRPEDLGSDSNYLKVHYPFEMWMMPHWFTQIKVEGFDWLGEDIENKPIPARYWQDVSRIKYLQRRLEIDTVYMAKIKSCQLYSAARLKVLSSQTLKGIVNSNDALLTKEYYNCLALQYRNSDYEALTHFYATRNTHLQAHLDKLLLKHNGKTMVIVTGADHYPFLLDHLKKKGVQTENL